MNLSRYFFFLWILSLIPGYSFSSSLEHMHISLIDGDVQIWTEDRGEWVPASINMPLGEGDRIWVLEEGKLELRLRDGTYVRLDERSALEVLTLDQGFFRFYLAQGHVYVNFRGQRGSFFQMDTPIASLRVHDRSVFKIDLSEGRLIEISVLKGAIDVERLGGKTSVKSGYTLALEGETYAELSPLGTPDEWERWNGERDRKLAEARPPSSYLPDELQAYSSDFETYGRWVYVKEYGYVWRPTFIASVGWAPYRIGRWVWIRGDYVWISYEPWGWVPCHYGRWTFISSFGWCWVPPVRGAVFWGPGFVAWIRTPTHVAWVPLGPSEIYYGYGHYGPYSVNISKINITNIHISKVAYRNIRVHDAMTVVDHETFVKAKYPDLRMKETPCSRERIHPGRPGIKPETTLVIPVVKEIPRVKRLSEPIRDIRAKGPTIGERETSARGPHSPRKERTMELKEARPFWTHLERSKAPGLPSVKGQDR